jgi:hypothetical protein
MVSEYPNVFPNDVPGMPPDRAIEFKIELQPGIASIYKQSYPMVLNELAKMKIQLQELLNTGYIRPNCSQWGCPTLFMQKKTRHYVRVLITDHSMW